MPAVLEYCGPTPAAGPTKMESLRLKKIREELDQLQRQIDPLQRKINALHTERKSILQDAQNRV